MKIAVAARIWLTRSFKPFLFKSEHDNTLGFQELDNLGLYIHIPFCTNICGFCPYCKEVYIRERANLYVDALLSEIEMVGSQSAVKKEVTSLYFGGGSPALVADRIEEIIDTVHKYFIITEGIGIELHPNNVNRKTLETLKNAGITKISIGVQSFQNQWLFSLGRKHIDCQKMLSVIREVLFETVSIDLIFAIPGQTFESLQKDIDTAFNSGANHVAIYPFIDFSFSDNTITKMNEKQKRLLLDDITRYCEKQGYFRTSIWTFAKEKNQSYSSMTRENFLGFGCSATTLLIDQFKINTFSVNEYINRIKRQQLPTSLTLRFTDRQRMVYYLFWTSYSTAVDPQAFEKFFNTSLKKKYGFEILLSRIFGFIKLSNGVYRMTLKGAYYYHYFEQFYTLAYIEKMWGILRHSAFPDEIRL